MNKPVLKVENLYKSYKDKKVLNGISFEMNEGEILSILGKNGVGKTTLLSSILKMIEFDSGIIKFNDVDIKKIKNSHYYKDVNIVLENSENIYYYMTGMQNILYFGSLYGYNKKQILERVNSWIDLFLLRDSIKENVSEYSRGMIQKLCIIISLINKPRLLLLDEPTLGLDIFSKRKMMDMLKMMAIKDQITIILTTHQMDVVEYLDSKVILIDKGRIIYEGNIDKLKLKSSDKGYIARYKLNNIVHEDKLLKENFDEVYQYLKDKNIDEIYEIKKHEKSLEELILEME